MPVIFVLDIFRQFLGTTAYSLGVTNAVPMLKGVALGGPGHLPAPADQQDAVAQAAAALARWRPPECGDGPC